MGYIQNSDISIDENSIIIIKNLTFLNNILTLSVPEKVQKIEEKEDSTAKNQLPKISQMWQKYLNNLFKKCENENDDDFSLYDKEFEG